MRDFEGIQKFKNIILFILVSVITINIVGPLYFYEAYLKAFNWFHQFFLLKLLFHGIMISLATYKAMKILYRVEKQKTDQIELKKAIFHSIVVPIYNESIQILKQTLQRLSQHKRAQKQYLVFLALQEHSKNPKERGDYLLQKFGKNFKLMHYTIHKLKPGQAKGKASNENFCLQNMEEVLLRNHIEPQKVMFTTIDCDNWMPQAYFDQVELFLSNNQWKMDKYMFAPNQMFTINNKQVPLFSRAMDYIMGSTLFAWSYSLTRVQNAASNYSLSFCRLKSQNFFDTNADAMCDDFHNSLKTIWKSKGEVEIVPIFIAINMISLQTGEGYFSNLKARFWQAERHMRAMLDAAYSFNMLFKNQFKVRTFWATISYFENHVLPLLMYLTAAMFGTFKVINGIQMTPFQLQFLKVQTAIFSYYLILYYLVIRKSSEVLYKQKPEPIKVLIEVLFLNKLVVLLYAIIPQVIATIRITLYEPTYQTAVKAVEEKKQKQQ